MIDRLAGNNQNENREVVLYEVQVLSRDSSFILKSLTSSKMRKCQTIKLSQLHKAKTCWTENLLA